jgi:copper chaperone
MGYGLEAVMCTSSGSETVIDAERAERPGAGQGIEQVPPAGAVVSTYGVRGMTCGHCVASVRGEIGQLPGVVDVAVDLVPGRTSTVTVTSAAALEPERLRAAVEEAGYDLDETGVLP